MTFDFHELFSGDSAGIQLSLLEMENNDSGGDGGNSKGYNEGEGSAILALSKIEQNPLC